MNTIGDFFKAIVLLIAILTMGPFAVFAVLAMTAFTDGLEDINK